ncbi:MAG: electron transfer flavoprotein subunit beta/FixA family protein [Deltaproteobacteria bacterium]|nr:electron transfer flavoprotein subunit beta/FixA family protein [Deltaproteobacteria bacterium]
MKILVMLKQTPDTESEIVISGDKKTIDHSQTKFIINPYDEFAIEEALRVKEKQAQCEVVLASFASPDAKERLIKGLAMGADRGLLVSNQGWGGADSLVVAQVMAAVIKAEAPSLVFCGRQGIDTDNMHVGVMVAELLGWPHVNIVTKMTINGESLVVEREVEGGQVEVYETRMPVVLGTHKSLNTPRYASLPGIMKAKKKPLDTKTPQDFGLDNASLQALNQTEVEAFSYPPEKPRGKIFKGEAVDIMVDKVVKLLREEAKVI